MGVTNVRKAEGLKRRFSKPVYGYTAAGRDTSGYLHQPVFLTVASDRVRISFGEAVGGMETHHLAVSMSHVDALELVSLISKLMDEHKAKQSTATKSMN